MIKHGKAPFLECSSKGDKRFSAFHAYVAGKSIEERYQAAKRFPDGSTGLSWREAKGRRPVNTSEVTGLYYDLWRRYLDQHPELVDILINATGLSDMFGQAGHLCQATTLWKLRGQHLLEGIESIHEYEVIKHEEVMRHERALAALKKRLEYFQSKCPHKKTSFTSDPAGDSSESYHTCVNCGKVL